MSDLIDVDGNMIVNITCPNCNDDVLIDNWVEHITKFCISKMEPEPDMVKQPAHYTQYKGMEPFTFFFLNNVPFPEATVCKYVLRWRAKNGIEDLRKAIRVCEMMIDMETNKADYTPKKPCL